MTKPHVSIDSPLADFGRRVPWKHPLEEAPVEAPWDSYFVAAEKAGEVTGPSVHGFIAWSRRWHPGPPTLAAASRDFSIEVTRAVRRHPPGDDPVFGWPEYFSGEKVATARFLAARGMPGDWAAVNFIADGLPANVPLALMVQRIPTLHPDPSMMGSWQFWCPTFQGVSADTLLTGSFAPYSAEPGAGLSFTVNKYGIKRTHQIDLVPLMTKRPQ